MPVSIQRALAATPIPRQMTTKGKKPVKAKRGNQRTGASRRVGREVRRVRERTLAHAPSPRRGSIRLGLALSVLLGINLYYFIVRDGTSIPDVMQKAALAGASSRSPLIDLDDDLAAAELDDANAVVPEADEKDEDIVVSGTVGAGDSLNAILVRHGLDQQAAYRAIESLKGHLDFRQIRPGQSYRLVTALSGELVEFEYRRTKLDSVVLVQSADGSVKVSKRRVPTQVSEVEIGGTIHRSLYQAIKDAGEDTRLVAFFARVFAYDLNFYVDTHPGDTFRLIVKKEYLDGELVRYGEILAAEYRGKAGTFRAIRFAPDGGKPRYFNEKGDSVAKTFLKTPLKFTRISSKFNPHRMHPVLHRRRGHMGVDYAAPTGTPIWSAASGKIVFRGRRGGAGNCVIVNHKDGYSTLYMHMSKFRKGQRVGSRVKQKEVIGYVGSTGLATGPHLHFGLKQHGRYLDPAKVKMTRSHSVAKDQWAAFKKVVDDLLPRLQAIDPR